MCVCVLNCSVMSDSLDPLDCSPPGSSVHGIFHSRILWSGFPFPIPDYLPNPRIKPTSLASPALVGRFFITLPPGKPGAYICVSVSSVAQLCPALCDPWTAAHQASLSITNSQGLLKLMSIKLGMPGDAIQSSHPLSSPSYSAFSLSQPHGLGLFQ